MEEGGIYNYGSYRIIHISGKSHTILKKLYFNELGFQQSFDC